MKKRVKEVDMTNAFVTPKGKLFMQWLEMTMNDDKDQSFKEIFEEFNEYYKSLFNSQV